jgi:hypothetical protein
LIVPSDLGSAYAAGRIPAESGRGVAEIFGGFYRGTHGPWLLGKPITGALTEDINGASTTVQYFQRGRLEWNIAAQRVDVSLLGRWAWDGLCSAPQ